MGAEDCIFCAIVAGRVAAEIVDSDDATVAFMDASPVTTGHSLVVPRRHAADLLEVGERDYERTMLAVRRLVLRIEETMRPDGFNVLSSARPAAWQEVPHFHVHVIPRYDGDGLTPPWVERGADADDLRDAAVRIRGE
ncbi:MAG: HIT domain-containing protein [Solirubrobacterales bacterium]|nr:HIT domain-containing protein [Solirubrobacterales bacterium]